MNYAVFAAGCFWGVQAYFDQVPGVQETEVGYTGGHVPNPTYEQVCTHTTGHAEAVKIKFDPHLISYKTLLQHFFRMHDATQVGGQGPDIGDSYRSAIFFMDDVQRSQAEEAKKAAQQDLTKPISTEITPAQEFYTAEAYHQKYFARTGMGGCHISYKPLA